MSLPPADESLVDRDLGRVGLKDSSIRGVAITFASQGARFSLNFAFQIWLARQLSPVDFGLVAMATPLLVFVGLFSDLGLTQATVQRPDITQAQLSLIFWINVGCGATLAAGLALASPLIAVFYHEPRVTNVVMVLAAGLLVGSLYAQNLALLTRRLEFGKLAAIDLSATCAGWVMAIFAALHGAGYWAILISQVGSSTVAMLLTYTLAPWRPNRPAPAPDWRQMLSFGGDLTLASLADLFSNNLDNVLIGKFSGSVPLGYYDRAYKLLLLPVTQIAGPIGRVAMPLLARVREEPGPYRRAYSRLTEVAALLITPPVIVAVVLGDIAIPLLLGPRWEPVAPIFRLLGIAALATPYGAGVGWIFFSQGRAREIRNWAFIRAALMVAGFVIGIRWGVVGVSASVVAVGLLLTPLQIRAAVSQGPVDARTATDAILPQLLGLALLAAAEFGLRGTSLPSTLQLLAGVLLAYPAYVAGVCLLASGRSGMRELALEGRQAFVRAISRPQAGG